jgi:hypothetical protein
VVYGTASNDIGTLTLGGTALSTLGIVPQPSVLTAWTHRTLVDVEGEAGAGPGVFEQGT